MFNPLLAAGLGVGAEGVASMVIKGLAVGGGFLVGYFLGTVVAWALDRWVFGHKAPPQLKKAVALVAGVGLAILVAMIVFGEGGKGLFGDSGDSGERKGTTNPEDGKAKPQPEVKKDEPKEIVPKPKEIPKPTPGDVHITILAGNSVKEGRFYLVDGDPTPKTFEEFKDVITLRRENANPELKSVYYRFRSKGEELSLDHPAVRQVYAWLSPYKIGFIPE